MNPFPLCHVLYEAAFISSAGVGSEGTIEPSLKSRPSWICKPGGSFPSVPMKLTPSGFVSNGDVRSGQGVLIISVSNPTVQARPNRVDHGGEIE